MPSLNMPVRSDDTTWPFDAQYFVDDFESICTDDLLSSGSFPSDDIWNKFEFTDHPLTEFTLTGIASLCDDDDKELDAILELSLDASNSCELSEIRHHDCMWAGHCGSKEHKQESVKISRPLLQTTCPQTAAQKRPQVAAATTTTVNNNAGRSLLLNSRNNPQVVARQPQQTIIATNTINNTTTSSATAALGNVGPRPDSPPSSDDDHDHPRFKHNINITLFDQTPDSKILQFLNDAMSECDFDEDSDLCDYFEDSEMFVGGESRDTTPRSYPGESDHSYHKGKGAQLRTDHLGVQTPSDSEEEIDVVSIGEKQLTTGRNCNTVLPTNPSMRDRQKLQRTVATAISNKREYVQPTTGGIKTRLPMRLPNNNNNNNNTNNIISERSNTSATKKTSRGDNRRGVKRGRHRYQKSSPGGSPAKRRGYGHSSDSDTECSEKRSLHNNMERQRRVDLRNAFDDLRVLVPEVACKERAAKVVILREAASYCDELGNESAGYIKQVAELRRQQERLRARVSQLRRSLAAKR